MYKEDKDVIMDLVLRKGNKIVMPLYVNIDGSKYKLLELDERIHSVTRRGFKVGFGCINSMGKHTNFTNTELLQYFQNVNMFTHFDYDTNITSYYYTFESDSETAKMLIDEFGEKTILNEIILYDERLFEHVSDIVQKYRENVIDRFHSEENM